jgi:hypothetical protein
MQLRLLATSWGWRLFRNDTGQAFVGTVLREEKTPKGTTVTLGRARRVGYGLAKGSSDLIGWRPTEDGTAQFVAIEAKQGSGRLTKEQRNFLRQVQEAGGYAAVARDGENGPEIEEYEP